MATKEYRSDGSNLIPMLTEIIRQGADNIYFGLKLKGETIDGPCWFVESKAPGVEKSSHDGGVQEFNFVFPCPGSPGCPDGD